MEIKKEINETVLEIKEVFSKRRYFWLFLVSAFAFFVSLYYLMVVTVADKSLDIYVLMSGPGVVTESLASIFVISVLSGIFVSMFFYKLFIFSAAGGNIFGFLGSGVAAFGVGCPTCGAFLFGLIGMPLALTYLPFKGMELRFLGIFVLLLSVYFMGKSLKGCKRKNK